MTERQLRLLMSARAAAARLETPPPFSIPPLDPDEVLRPSHDGGAWRAQPFRADSPAAREELARRVVEGDYAVHDTIAEQLAELLETRAPAVDLDEVEVRRRTAAHLGGVPLARHGTWFLYPWSRRAVHLLPEKEFQELRSSRNRNKITMDEQDRLRSLRIGIVGLSVGGASAMALAMEQIGGELFIADLDRLSLSNLNRLRAGVHELGLPKAVLTARAIAELDPYLRVRPFLEGVNEANLDAFLRPGGRTLDLLVEECDDLFVKVRIRERARDLRIPVVMETSDRGLLDVERFDLEPERPVFHGLIGATRAEEIRELRSEEKIPFVLRIVGERSISPRLAASLIEVKSTIKTWPQLASAVWLGAGVLADTVRRIALGQLTTSGRFYVDLEALVADGGGAVRLEPEVVAPRSEIAGGDLPVDEVVGGVPPLAPAGGEVRERGIAARASPLLAPERIHALVSAATLAPSGGNCQPWRFAWDGARLRVRHDRPRSRSFLDFGDLASWLAFGAAVENVSLSAAMAGLDLAVELVPDAGDPSAVCDLRFAPRRGEPGAATAALAAAIPARATNRRLSPRVPLAPEEQDALRRAAEEIPGATLSLVEDEERRSELGEVLGRGDRLRLLSRTMHQEMMSEVRWTAEDARRTRDGLDVATLELGAGDLAALRVMSSWPAMEFVARFGAGHALVRPARKAIAAASAVGLVTVAGTTREDFFAGGRAMQRVWLRATALGLSFQPMAPLTYLFARLEAGAGEGLSAEEVAALRELRARFSAVLPEAAGRGEPMLFRVFRGPPPTARALRRHVEDVLTME